MPDFNNKDSQETQALSINPPKTPLSEQVNEVRA
jgi:hypothetical protein